MKNYLAFDLGASSGRAILGTFDGEKITLKELHRFANGPISVDNGLYWDICSLFFELKEGLKKALATGETIDGMAIDTWGVDCVFIGKDGRIIAPPHHYRDPRTDTIMPQVFEKVSREDIYAKTGIQFMNFNTLFQLAASLRDNEQPLKDADKILFVPDALTYLFCGEMKTEYSIASTSQLLDANARDWCWPLIDALGLNHSLFTPITAPCTVCGTLTEALQKEFGCGPIPVIQVGAHDTASAVASVPADAKTSWAYLSSGTWSLLGVENSTPLISNETMKANYTNEGGLDGRIRFLTNIMGLWLIQECRNQWKRDGKEYSFAEIAAMAATAEPFRSLVDPNDPSFLPPGDMPARFAAYCQKTGQPVPDTPARIARTAFESLALCYRKAWRQLETLIGRKLDVLHLVGGGCQNDLLNQFTANAIQAKVVTGPVEATAMGNIVAQAIALNDISDLDAARAIIARSNDDNRCFMPQHADEWNAAFEKYQTITQSK